MLENNTDSLQKSGMKHEKTIDRMDESTGDKISRVQYAITADDYFKDNK